jgi:hypothetical protein
LNVENVLRVKGDAILPTGSINNNEIEDYAITNEKIGT